jgi:glycosyltransferase involved in cell wall biosynthesis
MIGLLPRVQSASSAVVRTCDERPDIAVVMHEFAGGGSRRDVIFLCNALAEKGVPVTILTLREAGPLRPLLDSRVPVVEIPGGRIRSAFFGMRRAIRAIAPRMVLCSESSLNICCLAAARTLPQSNRPGILLREVASPSAAQQHDPSWQGRLSYQILHRLYRFADRVITLTDGARNDLIENFSVPADKVVAMRANAVITPEIAERIALWDGEEGREENLIVSVGRLSPEKNHRLLLQALTLLRHKRPWRLALVGDGPERPALEEFVKANGLADQVTFVGYSADPFAWLMRARLAVCSSVYEGLCNAIIEALGCGTPVVSTDCPFGPCEILQNGRHGTLVPAGDAIALSAAIDSALDRPVDRPKLFARALDYTADRAADNFLEIVGELLRETTSAGGFMPSSQR